jgi:hypothetical protein
MHGGDDTVGPEALKLEFEGERDLRPAGPTCSG